MPLSKLCCDMEPVGAATAAGFGAPRARSNHPQPPSPGSDLAPSPPATPVVAAFARCNTDAILSLSRPSSQNEDRTASWALHALTSSSATMKKKMTAGQGKRPSPNKVVFDVPSGSEDDEVDNAELSEIIKSKQERVAQAKGKNIPLMLEPRVMLDFIDVWYQNPQTPIDDLKLPPGPSHVLMTFIDQEKWKVEKAKRATK
ncbi:uncharacterized protein LOC123427702 isoform X2 [Hordeum vulgare subsp. vulgare]|uniref:uncharacterized protein LOC123427702 isoform X2 n=1 Tax=Hordeum vulgare subsp. vulgare TaxID=112509 RepID=UPI001D1A5039|nr:uncharacterized protein LOC123427702 isoform X2 [Hordeum vulgare subsp. vulgare]